MRYTTSQFNETVVLAGRFASGATVTIEIIDLAAGVQVSLSSASCTSIADSEVGTGGNATKLFKWPSSNLTTQPTVFTQYVFTMTDTTGEIREGKFSLGGHPNESALQRYQGKVTIDTINGSAGTAFPKGTPEDPVNNLANALTIRSAFSLPRIIDLHGVLSGITQDLSGFSVNGRDPETDHLTFTSSANTGDCVFTRVGLRGNFTGATSSLVASECIIGVTATTVTGLRGLLLTCLVRGAVVPGSGVELVLFQVASDELLGTTIDFTGTAAATKVVAGSTLGSWIVASMTNATHQLGWALSSGSITLAASITAGLVSLSGYGERTLSHTSLTILTDTIIKATDLQRVHNPNVDTTLFYAVGAIAGRSVPAGGVSHVRLRGKTELATSFASPTFTKFIVYAYQSGATVSDAPASATPKDTAPVDGTFTSVTPP